MPYITQERRNTIGKATMDELSPGDLNYMFTKIIVEYMKHHNDYQGINNVLGALEGAKLEFYRRWAVPYEDYKISQNGDVYPTGG